MKEKVLSLSIATAMVGCSVLPAVAETTATLKESDSKTSAVRDTIEIESKSYYTHKKLIGKDRYETGVKIAEDLGKTDKLIIVNAVDNISDGLSASSLAGKLDASIIPINPNKIDKTTLELINNAKEIYLIGMYNAIPKKFEDSLTNEKVVRIGGKDRFETSEKIAKYIGDYDNAYIVNGFTGHADAMTMSTVAARDVDPIILTRPNKIPPKIEGVDYTVIGGTDAISNSIQSSLEADRIGGSDRYETNEMVLNKFYNGKDVISFCNGETLVDALSGANYAKDYGIALISKTKNHDLLEYRDTTQLGGLPYDIKFVNVGDTGTVNPPVKPESIQIDWNIFNSELSKIKNDSSIVNLKFINSIPENIDSITNKVNLSKNENEPVYSYIDGDTLVIASDKKIYANEDSSDMFRDCVYLKTMDLSNLDTSQVTNMRRMFLRCSSLTSLDLRSLDTSKVKDMSYMFGGCSSLTSLDLRSLDTSNVTDMGGMFGGCSSLTSLDLTSLDTSNVTNMNNMFYECSSLTSLNLTSLDTSNVTYMNSMFRGCSSLTSLDLTRLDTSNVTEMSSMCLGCSSLTSLDLTRLDTSNVTEMSRMFQGCSSLTSLDLRSLDTSNVTNMNNMFWECSSLTSLDLRSLDTSNVTNMNNMFGGCSSLTSLDLRSLDTSNVTYMGGMFQRCSSLTSLDLRSLDTSNVIYMNFMFLGCQNLTSSITISNSNMTYVEMFLNCSTATGSKFTVNYSSGCEVIAKEMVDTKSTNSNVVLGGEISQQQTNIN